MSKFFLTILFALNCKIATNSRVFKTWRPISVWKWDRGKSSQRKEKIFESFEVVKKNHIPCKKLPSSFISLGIQIFPPIFLLSYILPRFFFAQNVVHMYMIISRRASHFQIRKQLFFSREKLRFWNNVKVYRKRIMKNKIQKFSTSQQFFW